jgi:hypothetical protein
MSKHLLPLLAAAATLAAAAPAQADTLLAPAPAGSSNLAFGGGWLAWSQPEGDAFRLVLRAPDGTVTTPDIPAFTKAPDPSIGSTGYDLDRRILAVYERDGDIVGLDVVAGTEAKVAGASSTAYRESAPSIEAGGVSFVRSGGRHNGVFFRGKRLIRLSGTVARETAFNGSRVAWTTARGVFVTRLSLGGGIVRMTAAQPRDLQITRYQVAWRDEGGLRRTDHFGGSSRQRRPAKVLAAARTPEGLASFAVGQSLNAVRYLDAEGVKAPSDRLF